MRNMADYQHAMSWLCYTILRRLIQGTCQGIKQGQRPLKTRDEILKISYELEGKSLFRLRDIHTAYLY